MIFIGGISQGQRSIPYNGSAALCALCGGYGRYEIVMVYTYFSFFFIPLFRWNRRYYVRTTCCETLYELDSQVGRSLEKGQQTEIRTEHLTLLRRGKDEDRRQYGEEAAVPSARAMKEQYGEDFRMRSCPDCGYQFIDQEREFHYCPRCGKALGEKKEEEG